jgi:hypothetical protein
VTNTLVTPPAPGEPEPRPGRLVLLAGLRVFTAVAVVLAVLAGGYVAYTLHGEQREEQAGRQAEIRSVRHAVITSAAEHPVYAPSEWGAHEFPSYGGGTQIVSWGRYGPATVHLWQGSTRDLVRKPSRHRGLLWLATPESLCRFTAADRRAGPLLDSQLRAMRCSRVPGSDARIRVVPGFPHPGVADVRLAVALPEKGRYLNVWAIDEAGRIAEDPGGWATGFLEDLEPYDVTGYSAEDIYRAGAEPWYAE